jgi:hypothetical protein
VSHAAHEGDELTEPLFGGHGWSIRRSNVPEKYSVIRAIELQRTCKQRPLLLA